MRIPTIRGMIDRRVLVNYRVDPDRLAPVCPAPFRPQLVGGYGIAGICLIRLTKIRPQWLPVACGIRSENAAHRIAVEWDTDVGIQTGVFVPRRDTSSRLNAIAGGRLFPGVHHLARFDVEETPGCYRIAMRSEDATSNITVVGHPVDQLPAESIFPTLEACSDFFEAGSLGYSPASEHDRFDGLLLKTEQWSVQPLAVSELHSTFFADSHRFPPGTATFDNALLMHGIDHQWHGRQTLCGNLTAPVSS